NQGQKKNTMIDQEMRYAVKVRISHRKELENKLDRAVERAIREALKEPGRGVLVTRHDHQTFTVELSTTFHTDHLRIRFIKETMMSDSGIEENKEDTDELFMRALLEEEFRAYLVASRLSQLPGTA